MTTRQWSAMGAADRYLPVRSRCAHPGQQQGRRWPSSSSSWVRRMRRSRVVSCFASSTQQMNSFRARGVMSFHASSAVELATSALRRSVGNLCTTPPGTRGLLTRRPYPRSGRRDPKPISTRGRHIEPLHASPDWSPPRCLCSWWSHFCGRGSARSSSCSIPRMAALGVRVIRGD